MTPADVKNTHGSPPALMPITARMPRLLIDTPRLLGWLKYSETKPA